MTNIIIFGLEQFAQQMYGLLYREPDIKIKAFCVDRVYMPLNYERGGIPIIPFEDLESYFKPSECSILFCVGYTHMNQLRKERMDEALSRGYSIIGYRHPTALIQTDKIGYGNIFMENVIVGQGVEIGNGNIFWPAAHIAHHTQVGNYNFFTISVAVAGNILIHDFCVFGANCTVKNGIEINDGTLVGAGAYIAHSTESWSVYTPPRTYKLEGKSSLDFKL